MIYKSILPIVFFGIITISGFGAPASQDSTARNPSPKEEPSIGWLQSGSSRIHEFSLWGGYAFDSFNIWGKTQDATLGLLGLRYNRKFLKVYNHVLEYSAEVNIYAHYTYPEFEKPQRRSSLSGVGFSPLGLQFNFLAENQVQPFLKTSGGFMFLEGPFPDDRGRNFNFTFGAGGGLEIVLSHHASLSLGYQFFHLSNGETGQINPGVDSSFFYGGLTFF